MARIPAISGMNLIALLRKDGWIECGRGKHGVVLKKTIGGRTLVTVVPSRSDSMPAGTLHDILGSRQTRLGRRGLEQLIAKYGL